MTLLSQAEDFFVLHQDDVTRIVAILRHAGHDETDLDEMVTSGAERGRFTSEEASEVNNAGLAMQVASILEGNGVETGETLIREELGLDDILRPGTPG